MSRDLNSDFILKDCLFGGVKWAKNAKLKIFVYSGYSIEFGSRSEFSLSDGSVVKKSIFLEFMWPYLCILIIREKIS